MWEPDVCPQSEGRGRQAEAFERGGGLSQTDTSSLDVIEAFMRDASTPPGSFCIKAFDPNVDWKLEAKFPGLAAVSFFWEGWGGGVGRSGTFRFFAV